MYLSHGSIWTILKHVLLHVVDSIIYDNDLYVKCIWICDYIFILNLSSHPKEFSRMLVKIKSRLVPDKLKLKSSLNLYYLMNNNDQNFYLLFSYHNTSKILLLFSARIMLYKLDFLYYLFLRYTLINMRYVSLLIQYLY